MTPGDRVAQRPLAFRCIPRPTRQQRQALIQPREQSLRRKHPHPRCRKFDGERQSVQAMANFGNGLGIATVDGKAGRDSLGAVDEQAHRVVLGQLIQ